MDEVKKAGVSRSELLREAERIVTKDRQTTYGAPENSFATIADYWRTYLYSRFGVTIELNAADATAMLGLLKIARMANSQEHPDNWLDLMGYAACGGELALQSTATPTQEQPLDEPRPQPKITPPKSSAASGPRRLWNACLRFAEVAVDSSSDLLHSAMRSRLLRIFLKE